MRKFRPWNGAQMLEAKNGEFVRVDELSGDDRCHANAVERGQRTFTLVEQDPTAVETIAFWIMKNIHTAPADKLRKALQDCIDMRTYGDTHLMKPAD